jgi:hypothetical protein
LIVHVPTADPAVYVTDAVPAELVTAVADEPPFRRTPVQPAPLLNLTVSPATPAARLSLTVTDAVAVVELSAGTLAGLKVTAVIVYGILAGAGLVVWSTTAVPLPPVPDSVAVMVQKPLVVLEM